jgi:RecB family exonuclease
MTARRLTASGLALAAACPAAYALPAVEDNETDAMRAGTGRHAYLDSLALGLFGLEASVAAARDGALSLIPADASWRATCEAIDVERLLDVTGARDGRVEVGTVLTWWPATDTAETTRAQEHRAYRDDLTALHGTADWIVTAPDGGVTVVDFKGSMRGPAAEDHPQIAFYALAYARVHGLSQVTVALVYIDEDGTLTRDDHVLDSWMLDAWAGRFAALHARVAAAVAAPGEHVRVGDHCGNCPAMRVCPAMAALARELVAAPPSPETYPALDDAAAGAAWAKVQVLRELLDRAAAALRVRAERRGLPLPDGRWLTPVESTRRTVDVEKALPLLRQLVGDRAEGLVERSLSAAAVDALARELAAASGDTAKATGERVWTALREARAAREATYVQLRPKKLAGGAP